MTTKGYIKSNILYLAALSIVLLFVVFVRIRLLAIPLERDEGEFAYIGQLLLDGLPPYFAAYSMKPPGIFTAYALSMKLFGMSASGIHTGLLVINVLTALFLFFLAERVFEKNVGFYVAGSFAVISLSQSVLGVAAHATHYVLLFFVAGLLILNKATKNGRLMGYLGGGVLLGVSYAMKQQAAFLILFAVGYIVLCELERKSYTSLKEMGSRIALLFLGVAVPFAFICLIFSNIGLFDRFWFWTFTYPRELVPNMSLAAGIDNFFSTASRIVENHPALFILGGIGFISPFLFRQRDPIIFIFGLFVCSFVAISPGFYYTQHYFVLIIPSIAFFIGNGMNTIERFLAGTRVKQYSPVLTMVLFFLLLGCSVYKERNYLFHASPKEASRLMYGLNPFPESLEIAKYIQSQTSPEDSIVVIGSEPQIYFYSNRKSVTRFSQMYGLMEYQKYAAGMQQEMILDIENGKPKYLIYINIPTSWLVRDNSPKNLFSWLRNHLIHYQLVGIADIINNNDTNYAWDADALKYTLRSSVNVFVFKRRT